MRIFLTILIKGLNKKYNNNSYFINRNNINNKSKNNTTNKINRNKKNNYNKSNKIKIIK
jgi:hypothetical protein